MHAQEIAWSNYLASGTNMSKRAFLPTEKGQQKSIKNRVLNYYANATIDYKEWSPSFNMHFGYYKWGMNPFNREQMLNRMNEEVYKELGLTREKQGIVLDLGCGMGATARYIDSKGTKAQLVGVSIVPWQVEQGNALSKACGSKVRLLEADYTQLPFEDRAIDGAYALESACHAMGKGKESFVRELARVLKPGSRFVIADGFIKAPATTFNPLMNWCYRGICKYWALPGFGELNQFVKELELNGLTDIQVKDISWNIAPSVLHAPMVTLKFWCKKKWKKEPLGEQSINNFKGGLMSLLVGLNRSKFGYYIISGIKQ